MLVEAGGTRTDRPTSAWHLLKCAGTPSRTLVPPSAHLTAAEPVCGPQEPGSGAHTLARLLIEASGRLIGLLRPRFYRDEHLSRHKAPFGRFGSTAEQSDTQSQCLPPFYCRLRINRPTSDDKHANGHFRIVFAQAFSAGGRITGKHQGQRSQRLSSAS